MSTVLSLLGPLWPYLAALVGGASVILGAYLRGRSTGKATEAAKQAREQEAARQVAKDIGHEVDQLGAADVDRRLAEWVRKQ
jgi:hypothetical protein